MGFAFVVIGRYPYSSFSVATTRGFVRWPPRKVYRKVSGVGIQRPYKAKVGMRGLLSTPQILDLTCMSL